MEESSSTEESYTTPSRVWSRTGVAHSAPSGLAPSNAGVRSPVRAFLLTSSQVLCKITIMARISNLEMWHPMVIEYSQGQAPLHLFHPKPRHFYSRLRYLQIFFSIQARLYQNRRPEFLSEGNSPDRSVPD